MTTERICENCKNFEERQQETFFLEPGILADTGYSQLYVQFPDQEDKFLIAILNLEIASDVRDGLNKRWFAYLDYLAKHDLT